MTFVPNSHHGGLRVHYKFKSILYGTVPYNVEYEKIDARIVNLNSLIEEKVVKQ